MKQRPGPRTDDPTQPRTSLSGQLAIGVAVDMRANHHYHGHRGIITNTPGKVFNGWCVKLDNGLHVGASAHQMRTVKT